MLQIIISLLLSLGIQVSPDSGNYIQVINQATGESYGIGTTIGVGSKPPTPTQVYYLIQDENGNYSLVRR